MTKRTYPRCVPNQIIAELETSIVVSLFDYTGAWSRPYRQAGYRVIQIDTKLGIDLMNWDHRALDPGSVVVVLAAPPCVDFTAAGACWWKIKDQNGSTDRSVGLVRRTLEVVEWLQPEVWAIENPPGRIHKLIPELGKGWFFHPWWYGDPWKKHTGLWGRFTAPVKTPVEPEVLRRYGSWTQDLGSTTRNRSTIRGVTPPGFAKAFAKANDPAGLMSNDH